LLANLAKLSRDRRGVKQKEWAMAIEKSIASSSLAEVVDRILDKGVVIDAFVRVALVGIELLAVEARIVIASVETWLKYADAVGLVSSPMEA
jgi:gas vesicle structural protein